MNLKKVFMICFLSIVTLAVCFAGGNTDKPGGGGAVPESPGGGGAVPESPGGNPEIVLPDLSDWPQEEINFILDSGPDKSLYDIGFSSIPVTQWATKPSRMDKVTLVASIAEDGSAIAFNEEPVNVYWRLNSFDGLKVSMKIGEMVQEQGKENHTLQWSVAFDNKDKTVNVTPSSGFVEVCVIPKSVIMQSIGGSVPLTIKTESLYGSSVKFPYTSKITLKIDII